jgi:hypothetical protein
LGGRAFAVRYCYARKDRFGIGFWARKKQTNKTGVSLDEMKNKYGDILEVNGTESGVFKHLAR